MRRMGVVLTLIQATAVSISTAKGQALRFCLKVIVPQPPVFMCFTDIARLHWQRLFGVDLNIERSVFVCSLVVVVCLFSLFVCLFCQWNIV